MPSPTVSTVPVSITDTFWSYSSICLRMICEISSALISIGPFLFSVGEQLLAEVVELGADAAVVHDVAHLGDDPAEQRRVFALLQDHGLAGALLEDRLEP